MKYGVFSESILNGVIKYHRQFKDENLRLELKDKPEDVIKLVEKYFHCG